MAIPHFQTIGIIAKRDDERLAHLLPRLIRHLQGHHRHILLDASAVTVLRQPLGGEPTTLARLAKQADLAIVIGGDGTFLMAARALVDAGVPLLGINIGRLGFLVDVSPHEMASRLDEILAGEYVQDYRAMLCAEVYREEQRIARYSALNDVVLHIRGVVRMIDFDTWIDGHFVNTQRADGMVIATPTGSTAYALSGGGPIIAPSLDAMVLVPICPQGLSNRPLVVHTKSCIEIRVNHDSRTRAQVSFDGQNDIKLKRQDRLLITQKPRKLRLIHPVGYDYLSILRAKLGWGERP
ncbi:NAD(+) kinase [Thiorhodospira sibirica]|uniref:NAD(+) kinase n=1 Tax=Thiorhodospira sibirica TaxID=154347 RepID=UPI00022C4625|nr:NAD(+) kinase [Thiorhodospira sibirica]